MTDSRKRMVYTKEENDLLTEILRGDADATAYILNKGVIKVSEKGQLYIRLTQKYNKR